MPPLISGMLQTQW